MAYGIIQNNVICYTEYVPHTVTLLNYHISLDLEHRKMLAYPTKSSSNIVSERHSGFANDCQNGEDGHEDDQLGSHFQVLNTPVHAHYH